MNIITLRTIVKEALEEDIGFADPSSDIFPENHCSTGTFTAKSDGVLAGMEIIGEAYALLDDAVEVTLIKQDGEAVKKSEEIATAEGPTSVLLKGERVILNLLQHLGGIATAVNKAVTALGDPEIQICDTRKTLPGLRMLQKYAVRCGGGYNHRLRLDGGIMIKDNHIRAAGSIAKAVGAARKQAGLMTPVEVETENRDQVLEAVAAGADIIMFDNRPPEEVASFVELVPGHIVTEASGGITVENIGSYAGTGVDYISLGSLTHSVTALDISFNLNSTF